MKFFLSIIFIPVFLFLASGSYALTDPEQGYDSVIEDADLFEDEGLDFTEDDTEELFDELDSIMNETLDDGFFRRG